MKKTIILLGAAFAVSGIAACNSKSNSDAAADSAGVDTTVTEVVTVTKVIPGSYRDLKTGKTVYIIRDPETGYAYDSISRVPIEFYIDNNNDTLYQTGEVVSNALIRNSDGTWNVDEAKIKVRGDRIKIKTDTGKTKIDLEDGEMKTKSGSYKQKVDVPENQVKEKDGTTKTNTEDGVTTTKPKN